MILKINGKSFDFFESTSVQLKYDSVGSTFSFTAFFDVNNSDHRNLFKPLTYRSVVIEHQGKRLITGVVLNSSFSSQAESKLVTISGYSKTGVLEDCEIPVDQYPLQSDGQSLIQIARKLASPFGITVNVDPIVSTLANEVYDTTTAGEKQTVKSYLTELATQKNVIITHDEFGNLLLTKVKSNIAPITTYKEDISAVSIKMKANGQKMHNLITVQKEADDEGSNAGEASIENPYVSIFRPTVKSQSSGDDNDTQKAATNALAAELKNISLTIETDSWFWIVNGSRQFIEPNNIISVLSPSNYLFKKTNFFVQSVSFKGNASSQTATLTCVLPEVYNGEIPKNTFE